MPAKRERVEALERDDGEGWVTSDGEPYDIPEGESDIASYAAHQAFEATQQAARWAHESYRWKALVMANQENKSARYGDLVAVIKDRDLGRKKGLDSAAFAEGLMGRLDLYEHLPTHKATMLEGILRTVTAIDRDRLQVWVGAEHYPIAEELNEWLGWLAAAAAESTGERSVASVEVSQVRKRFPGS